MKLTHYIYICSSLVMLTACHHDDIEPVYTVGEEDNAICLEAGIVDGGAAVKTRASWDDGSGVRHEKHLALANDIKMTLRVDGIWTGHKNASDEPEENISKTSTAKVGQETVTDSKHNSLSLLSDLYWDDYGTADPANKVTGRTTGLTIYGAAINDASQSAPTISDWTSFPCSVESDQTGGWSSTDLIVSNNVQATSAGKDYTGTLKFDARTDGNLLEFKHVMSKVTFMLTANKGFVDSKFEGEPTVQMHGFYTSGILNITNGETSGQSGGIVEGNPSNIETYCENTTKTGQTVVTRSALVVPGRTLTGTEHIATVTADGNVYKITAAKIYAAMTKPADGSNPAGPGATMKSGYNYVLKIFVDKTEVHVEATVANWIDVVAEIDYPKIDIDTSYGTSGNNFGKDYSFYYSKNKDYIAGGDLYGTLASDEIFFGRNRRFINSSSAFDTDLYWPNHSVGYFFRGIWPETTTVVGEVLVDGDETSVSIKKPSVKLFTAEDDNQKHQGIYVRNMKYVKNTFPSDLMIAIPTIILPDESSKFDEPETGIKATEGKISMNFSYRMAQVEVHLMSSGAGSDNNIDFGSNGGAEIAQVSIVDGMTAGYILLADGSVKYDKDASSAEYIMTPLSTDLTSVTVPTPETYAGTMDWTDYPTLVRHDAVIPQSLGTDVLPLKFRIKTGSSSSSYDIYEIPIKDINITSINGISQSANRKISEWEAGKHYIYTLKITKTKVTIEASIQDWIPVVAGGDFWL